MKTSEQEAPVRLARRGRPLVILLALGLVLIGCAAGSLYLYFSRSIGSGPAGPSVDREGFTHPWTRRPVFLVGLGDSVTAGFGARRGYGYFDLLATNSPDDFADMKGVCLAAVFPHLLLTNLSVSGSISHEVGGQIERLPRANNDTVGWVVITTGGNDLIHNYGRTPAREQAMYGATWDQAKPWIDHFEQRLEDVVARVTEHFPGGCHIFLANIYDPTDGAGDTEPAGLPKWPDGLRIIGAYNEVIHHCVEKHLNVHLVNFHDAFLGHGIHCAQFWSKHYDSHDPHYWYYFNLEDPNERGYDAIRRLFLIEMARASKQLR